MADAERVGVVGLLVLLVVALVRGWLVTARELASTERDRDHWRTTAEAHGPLIKDLASGQEKLVVAMETTNHLLRSLPGDREAS